MKKFTLFFLMLCLAGISCVKHVTVPLEYTLQYDNDVYAPATGAFSMPVAVKFLTGNTYDSVSISLTGLPPNVAVSNDSVTALPSYNHSFNFTTTNAALGVYPLTITAYSSTTGSRNYNFNLRVIPADCATLFLGTLNASNACTSANYTYTVTAAGTGTPNTLLISNLGGYGTTTKARVELNCEQSTLNIPSQNIGNGVILQGSGTFTATSMTIMYTTPATPQGFADQCTTTLTR